MNKEQYNFIMTAEMLTAVVSTRSILQNTFTNINSYMTYHKNHIP